MRGEYRVKNEALKELWEEASDLESRFGKVRTRPSGGNTMSSRTSS